LFSSVSQVPFSFIISNDSKPTKITFFIRIENTKSTINQLYVRKQKLFLRQHKSVKQEFRSSNEIKLMIKNLMINGKNKIKKTFKYRVQSIILLNETKSYVREKASIKFS
jgi:hypothetical protein